LGGATEMLFAMRILESMGLHVKKLMILYVDNKGMKDWRIIGVLEDEQDMLKFVAQAKISSIVLVRQCPVMFEKSSPRHFRTPIQGVLWRRSIYEEADRSWQPTSR
jgi:hypothetical protein